MRRDVRGFTLIELVVAIVIIGVVATTVLGVTAATAKQSAEAMMQEQSAAIARAYIEEITSKSFAPIAPVGGARAFFNDVADYNNLPDTLVRDQTGTAIAGLGDFRVQVAVASVALGSSPNAVPAGQSRRIVVTVTDPLGQVMSVTAYRTGP